VAHQAIDERGDFAFMTSVSWWMVRRCGDRDAFWDSCKCDFLGTVAGFDLSAALREDGGLLLIEFHFVETRAENAHGLGAILDLRFFVLLGDDEAAGKMRNAHGGVGGVDRLAAGPEEQKVSMRRSLASILMSISSASEGRRRCGGGVNAALGLRVWHALHA